MACQPRPGLPELEPPQPTDRVLIIAPHIDDETIGAAGYAMAAAGAGASVSVVYLTAGDDNIVAAAIEDRTLWPRARDYLHEGAQRIEEGKKATLLLGISNLYFLGYPDRGLEEMIRNPDRIVEGRGTRRRHVPYPQALSPGAAHTLANLLRDARRVAALTRPTILITTVEFDEHPDHRAAATIGRTLASEMRPSPRLLRYLVHARGFPEPHRLAVHQPLLPPARFRGHDWAFFPIDAASEEKKRRACELYTSQWADPVVRELMEAFIRRNEVFLVPSPGAQ